MAATFQNVEAFLHKKKIYQHDLKCKFLKYQSRMCFSKVKILIFTKSLKDISLTAMWCMTL